MAAGLIGPVRRAALRSAGQLLAAADDVRPADVLAISVESGPAGALKVSDLYRAQPNATVALLKTQQPLIKKYWGLASQEISLFQSGTTVAGAAWPYLTNTLKAAKAPSGISVLTTPLPAKT